MQQYFDDIPRVLERRLKKKAGLPASADVGVLASVIKKLRSQIESDLKITVSDATLATIHLEALYQDDVEDICEYAGFKYIIPKSMYRPILWEASCAYAGYGQGLCKHWQNDTQCRKEIREMEDLAILAVHYSRKALTSTWATVTTAIGTNEPWGMRTINFKLGSDAKVWYLNEEDYWHDVKGVLVGKLMYYPREKPKKIIVTGDEANGDFMRVLEEAMMEYMRHVPPIFSNDTVVAAAKGAAEFRRRGQAPWQ